MARIGAHLASRPSTSRWSRSRSSSAVTCGSVSRTTSIWRVGSCRRATHHSSSAPRGSSAISVPRSPRLTDTLEQLVYELSSELLQTGRLSEPFYRCGVDALGERGLVELVSTIGYYCLVSLTLNAFELGLPEAVAPELNDHGVAPREPPR